MNQVTRKNRLSPPLMYAFRSAYQERAAQKIQSLREEDAPPPAAEPTTAERGKRAGERVVTGRRSARAPITEPLLKQQVARDLASLMNTINLESAIDLDGLEAVKFSILNFGVREVTSRYVDQLGNGGLLRDLRAAVLAFEPRLIAKTVKVMADERPDDATLLMRFNVSADLSCDPVAVPVAFVADLEVDSGKILISRLISR